MLELLLKVADKASQIAKIIRKEKPLVDLLIEEKSGLEKNSRFFQDFKTLADVLIQETVRHYISQQVCQLCLNTPATVILSVCAVPLLAWLYR